MNQCVLVLQHVWIACLFIVSDSSVPCCPAAQRVCCTDRHNADSWLADTWNSPYSTHCFCCSVIGWYSLASWSWELLDKYGKWWSVSVHSQCPIWTGQDWLWIWQHHHGLLFVAHFTHLATWLLATEKGKVVPYLLLSIGPGADPSVQVTF